MNYKKALISGVCGGIGKAILAELKAKSIAVIGVDYLDDPRIALEDYFKIDLSNLENLEQEFSNIFEKHPDIDLVINNAGIANIKSFEDETVDEFQKVMDINFNSLVISSKFWFQKFKGSNHKTIANMASMAGHVPPSGMTSYSASKHAVVGFTQSLQLEVSALELKTNIILISPGFIKTDIMKIGEEGGFPESLSFMIDSPEKAAKKIVKGLINKQSIIIPDYSGRMMKSMQRISPSLLEFSNKLVAKNILNKKS